MTTHTIEGKGFTISYDDAKVEYRDMPVGRTCALVASFYLLRPGEVNGTKDFRHPLQRRSKSDPKPKH